MGATVIPSSLFSWLQLERNSCTTMTCEHWCSLACGVSGCIFSLSTWAESEPHGVDLWRRSGLVSCSAGVECVLAAVLMTRWRAFLQALVPFPNLTVMLLGGMLLMCPLWTWVTSESGPLQQPDEVQPLLCHLSVIKGIWCHIRSRHSLPSSASDYVTHWHTNDMKKKHQVLSVKMWLHLGPPWGQGNKNFFFSCQAYMQFRLLCSVNAEATASAETPTQTVCTS